MLLVGRAHEVERIGALLASGRPVALVGPAGIGKSTLASAVLDRLGPHRTTGALASLRWRSLAPVARLLGDEPPTEPSLAAAEVVRRSRTPVLLDDLQWADDATFDVVGFLVGQVPVVASVRTGEDGSARALEILDLLGFVRLEVSPLGPEAAQQLARHRHPALDPAGLADLVRRSAGSPLLIAELGYGAAPSPSLASALLDRVVELPAEARLALERLAVLARPCERELLGPGSDALVEAGIAVDEGPSIALGHALLGEVLVEQLGPTADDVRLALVPLVGPGEAAHLLEQAGRPAAARELALRSAVDAPESAQLALLDLAVRCGEGVDLQERFDLGRLLVKHGRPDRAIEVCEEGLERTEDPIARGTLLVALAEARWARGERERAAADVEEASVLLRGSDTAAEVLALAGRTYVSTSIAFDPASGLALAREAVSVAERIGQEQRFARWRLAALLQAAELDGWEPELELVLAACDEAGDEDLRHLATVTTVLHRWMAGESALAERLARGEAARIDGRRQTLDRYNLAAYQAILALQAGVPPERIVAEHAGRLDEVAAFPARPFLTTALAIALAESGRYDEAGAMVEEARGAARGDLQAEALAAWAEADIAWQLGRWSAAAAVADRLVGGLEAHPAGVQARLCAAHGRVAAGDALPPGDPPAGVRGFLAGAPGEWFALGRWADGDVATAADGFRAAAERWMGADERARWRCRWAAAECARLAGDPAAADELHAIEHVAARLGYRSLLVRTARSLRQAGSRPWAPGAVAPGGLTARELEVLDLVSMGMSTHEVAAALGVASSTVETVLASARRRLGVPTRVAAVAELTRLRAEISG